MAKSTKKAEVLEQKAQDSLQDMSREDLQAELTQARKNLYTLSMKKDLGELKQTHQLRQARKYIARLSTFLHNAA